MNFYDSIIEGAQELPASERGQLYTAALEYLYLGREPDFKMKPAPRALFVAMRPVFDNQIAKQKAGAKGGKARADRQANAKQNASKRQAEPKQSAKQNATEQEQEQEQEVEETPKGVEKKRARFKPPTPEEVDAYLAERGLDGYLTGTQFVGYYGSQGWRKANGQPVTNWKLAACGWADRERKKNPREGRDDGFDDFKI